MNQRDRWRVIELDLARELPELGSAPGYDGVRVIYRFRGRAIGHSDFTDSQLPLSSTQLAIAAAHHSSVAIGDGLRANGFKSSLPGLPEPELSDPLESLKRLVHEK